jgi:zinc transporter ZupT
MVVAALLTALALVGLVVGVLMHRGISPHLAALGGVLLLAVVFIWVAPEIAESWGWPRAVLGVTVIAVLLAFADSVLVSHGHSPRHGVIGPLLAATAIHSLLDGWSIRVLATQPGADILVPLGLGLHKLPEGFALGWALRRSVPTHRRAIAWGTSAQLFTLVGAFLQPAANRSGLARFGSAWTPAVLTVVAGAFIFLACHTLLPYFKFHRDH